jgi:hypothetical protein
MTRKIPVNPKLPRDFDNTPNGERPKSHMKWWDRPYIVTEKNNRWPGGVRYDLRCLDGGAWDRSTCWGCFATLDEAIAAARARIGGAS